MITLRTKAFDLPLRHVFTIARGSVEVQRTLIVEVSGDGLYGYGEATENAFYGATLDSIASHIKRVERLVDAGSPDQAIDLLPAVAREIGGCDRHRASCALCAIDTALHDLWGKWHGQPLHKIWGLQQRGAPLSNLTIGIDAIPKMVEKLEEEPRWPVYKVKLGTPNDIEIIRRLRRHTRAPFRVDANCGWTASQTIELAPQLQQLGVELIEQPLPPEDVDGMRRVYAESTLPVFADESCVHESDVDACAGCFHGVNIKLVKCGGLAPARRMIRHARDLGLRVMMGCMTESTVGISAIAQVLPELDFVDMDGAALLSEDIARGARVENGRCNLPPGNGAGIELLQGPLA